MGRWKKTATRNAKRARTRRAYREYMDPIIDEAERIIRARLLPHADDINQAAEGNSGFGKPGQLDAETLDEVLDSITYEVNFRRRKLRTYATANWVRKEVTINHLYIKAAREGTDLFSEMNMDGKERFAFLLDTIIHELTHILQPIFLGTRSGHGSDWRWVAGVCGAVPIGCTNWRKRLRKIRARLLRDEDLAGKQAAIVEAPEKPLAPRPKATRPDGRSRSTRTGAADYLMDIMLRHGPPSEWSESLTADIQHEAEQHYPRHKTIARGVRNYCRTIIRDGRKDFVEGWKTGKRGQWFSRMRDQGWDMDM